MNTARHPVRSAVPTPPTREEVETIKARAERATKGPLGFSPQAGTPKNCLVAQVWHQDGKALAEIEATADPAQASADAELFSHARTDIITLCDWVLGLLSSDQGGEGRPEPAGEERT